MGHGMDGVGVEGEVDGGMVWACMGAEVTNVQRRHGVPPIPSTHHKLVVGALGSELWQSQSTGRVHSGGQMLWCPLGAVGGSHHRGVEVHGNEASV